MNCNHGVSVIADAWYKGVRDFDLQKAYTYTKAAIEEKTLAPWSSAKAGWIDRFYKEKGISRHWHRENRKRCLK